MKYSYSQGGYSKSVRLVMLLTKRTWQSRTIPHENVSDRTRALPWSLISDGAGEFYEDPLHEGGVDLSEIPEDFDNAPQTIERRERIEIRWKR
ncbi:hypothetical protein NUU61_000146 [Penicillium alfredii]|uniref:Uncharacterized protein n=1 Tax=Penicillium alfredii TaxID=1506179 RepID=A0A9W9G9C7_9EURO|nr:uncharacterized protein NUU61_000146 [Penicillium alfredii]KAJ5114387.1 hypothetical protein NUU61_000146 [Penicillium alfredii]